MDVNPIVDSLVHSLLLKRCPLLANKYKELFLPQDLDITNNDLEHIVKYFTTLSNKRESSDTKGSQPSAKKVKSDLTASKVGGAPVPTSTPKSKEELELGFNLAIGQVEQVEMYLPSESYFASSESYWQNPVHVEFAENLSKFLISEPEYNRIGVYSGDNLMEFQGWFGGRSNAFDYPTSILYMDNGDIVVLECSKINFYDKDAKLIQTITGRYKGLAKTEGGDFVSTQKCRNMTTCIVVVGQVNGEGVYQKCIKRGYIKNNRQVITKNIKSEVRSIAVHDGKIYISDFGLDSIHVVDMQTGSQVSWELDCKEPSGMLVDDLGNVLVADSGNSRLVVLNVDGEFVREFGAWSGASSPCSIMKVVVKGEEGVEENHILVTYSGNDGTDGRIARFKCV